MEQFIQAASEVGLVLWIIVIALVASGAATTLALAFPKIGEILARRC